MFFISFTNLNFKFELLLIVTFDLDEKMNISSKLTRNYD